MLPGLLVIIYAHKKQISTIILQRVHIPFAFDLSDSALGCLIPFQFQESFTERITSFQSIVLIALTYSWETSLFGIDTVFASPS